MITIKKLLSLKEKTRIRKIIKIIQEVEFLLSSEKSINLIYLKSICGILIQEKLLLKCKNYSRLKQIIDKINNKSGQFNEEPRSKAAGYSAYPNKNLIRNYNSLRHFLMKQIGEEPGDWDFFIQNSEKKNNRSTFPFRVFLEDIRSPFNVGSIFRTAESFGAKEILLSPDTPSPEHKRVKRSSMGCAEILPWEKRNLKDISNAKGIFALELGGTSLMDFKFPKKGIVIIGSEELGISPEAKALAKKQYGIVTIPMIGQKASLNVGVAFGILMNAWINFNNNY